MPLANNLCNAKCSEDPQTRQLSICSRPLGKTSGQDIMRTSHRPNIPTVRSRHLSGPRTLCFHSDLLHSAIKGIYQLVLDALKFITELAHTCTTVIVVEESNTAQSGCATPCISSLLQQ